MVRGEIEIACTALRYRRFAWGRGRHPEVGRKFRRVSGVLRVFAGVEFGTVELVRVAASGSSNEHRDVAGLRLGWLRPAPLKLPYWGRTTYSFLTKWAVGSQEFRPNHRPILGSSSSARPPRAAKESLSPRTAILRIALFALSLSNSPPTGTQPSLRKCNCFSGLKPAGPKTSMASCGPPLGEASARATLRVAEARPKPPPKSTPHARPGTAGKPATVFPPEE